MLEESRETEALPLDPEEDEDEDDDPEDQCDKEQMAAWYAGNHLRCDPGVRVIYYLRQGAPEREIRFLEVNEWLPPIFDGATEPLNLGVHVDSPRIHELWISEVTPAHWEKIQRGELAAPEGWSLEGATVFKRPGHE